MQLIKTVCGMCGVDNCGIDVYVDGGRIVDIKGMAEHPMNRGHVCPQARAAMELAEGPDRLDYPLRRSGGAWERITWDEALDTIAERLGRLKSEEGAQALAIYQGRALLQGIRSGWAQRFMNVYGSPNFVRNDHMCAYPVAISEMLTFGSATVYGADGDHTQCLLLWGSDHASSHIPTVWQRTLDARKRGAKLAVVDPRRTRTAAKADIHLAPRPGTDAALALGLMNVIIDQGLYDADFVARWTTGFSALAERVAEFTPEKVAAITGVPASQIQELAELYATTKPAYLDAGNALEHHTNAIHVLRSLMILRAITGNVGIPGGHSLVEKGPLADNTLMEKRPIGLQPLGTAKYPIFLSCSGFVPGDVIIDTVLTGKPYPVKAMIIGGGNPMLTWPSTAVVRQALERLEFSVVMDLRMTETAKLADIVLPAASAMEKYQLIVTRGPYGDGRPTNYMILRKPVLDPGERRSDLWFWTHLAQRMGYGRYFPWSTDEEGIDFELRGTGISIEDLKQQECGLFIGDEIRYRKHEEVGFNTPTGKLELYSHVLEAAGYDPLPSYEEPSESPVSTPDLATRYPLVLDCGRRSAFFTHSRHRELPGLRRADPEALAELHPETARAYGISDGDWIQVESPRGAIELKARVTDAIVPGTVSLLHGWSEANANLLTDYAACDRTLSCPSLRAALCRVRKV